MSFKLTIAGTFLILAGMSFQALAKYTPEQVKAVYIYRIANFIHWNQDSVMTQVNICVPDNPSIKEILTEITQDKQIRNKPIRVVEQDCHILFISQLDNLPVYSDVRRKTVSISDMDNFTDNGGVIELNLNDGRIKPRVNLDNIGDYSISSNFLRVSDIEGGANEASQ
ncbi:YfiR family protein [Vibrio hepatarius]|jgi:hypothetical protein|uniref:DUF4154 domain-containing protein n=1 Tax=Vibrio hepatarius TaxID=171383 RepID=A0A0M0I5N9_9VIBR|nr:YfiR family protein [Vibrio hepatarius]KOO09432.1 hypothetical protein AKJ31_03515 [Vibrio hepatarius]NOI13752.1 YfiR family protein [Vibrio hepatarius]